MNNDSYYRNQIMSLENIQTKTKEMPSVYDIKIIQGCAALNLQGCKTTTVISFRILQHQILALLLS